MTEPENISSSWGSGTKKGERWINYVWRGPVEAEMTSNKKALHPKYKKKVEHCFYISVWFQYFFTYKIEIYILKSKTNNTVVGRSYFLRTKGHQYWRYNCLYRNTFIWTPQIFWLYYHSNRTEKPAWVLQLSNVNHYRQKPWLFTLNNYFSFYRF